MTDTAQHDPATASGKKPSFWALTRADLKNLYVGVIGSLVTVVILALALIVSRTITRHGWTNFSPSWLDETVGGLGLVTAIAVAAALVLHGWAVRRGHRAGHAWPVGGDQVGQLVCRRTSEFGTARNPKPAGR